MFRFAHPEYLYGLYLIPLLVIFYWVIVRTQKKAFEKFAAPPMKHILIGDKSSLKPKIKFGVIIISLVLLIFSLANPQIGTRIEEVKQTGIDVFIALDVSLSMKAEDIKPNRLGKAKQEISNLIKRLKGDRIGLIIFSGAAYVQFPLTTDYSAANLFLAAVDVSSVPQQGTAIASAIELATKSFHYPSNTQKAIVIITDGEDHEGNLETAVETTVEKGIKIFTIGLGSSGGVPIPIYNAQGNQIGFKQEKSGNTVLTKLDDITLRELAEKGNGKFYLGTNYQDELDLIYKDLSQLEKAEFGSKRVTDYEDRFYYLLIPALFLLFTDFFISERKWKFFQKLIERISIK